MKMELIEGSETSAITFVTPGNYPKENVLHTEHGESLKSRTFFLCGMWGKRGNVHVAIKRSVYALHFVIIAQKGYTFQKYVTRNHVSVAVH